MGIFGSSPSNEYALLGEHFKLDRQALFEVANGAVDSIFGPESEKERLRTIFTSFAASQGLAHQYMP